MIRYHDISDMERYFPPIDYRDKGRPISDKAIGILLRWKKETRSPQHFLASVIAPHVMHHQEPDLLLGGRPVHMMITRSLLKQCRAESHHEFLPYDPEVKKIKWQKVNHTNKVGARDRANIGFRLTSMFSKAIAMVYKELPLVIDDEAKEYRRKKEYYKQIEELYKKGDHRVSQEDLQRLRKMLSL